MQSVRRPQSAVFGDDASIPPRLYLAIASNGTAEPIASISKFTISGQTDSIDVTCFGDTTKTALSGLPDASGSFSGVFDTSVLPSYLASQDGIARKLYFYWDTVGDPTHYFLCTATLDFSSDFDVAGAGATSGNWRAATPLIKV